MTKFESLLNSEKSFKVSYSDKHRILEVTLLKLIEERAAHFGELFSPVTV